MKYKSFIITVVSITTFMFSLLAGFNYFYDSYGFFHNNQGWNYAAKAIGQGKMVGGLENYDEREFQKQIFKNFIEVPECIVIGSSKSMMIEANMVKCEGKFFNHSVSDASLEDYIAIVGIYAKHHRVPKKIILGIDPWIFNENTGRGDWIVLKNEYAFMLSKIAGTEDMKNKSKKNNYLQLINFDNTVYNIEHLNQKSSIEIITSDTIDSLVKRADGSIAYPYKIRFQTDVETQKNASMYIVGKVYNLEDFKELHNKKLFEKFISYMKGHDIEVEFFLPPYHPIVYDYLATNANYRTVLTVEKYLNDFAIENKIKVYGSYNPHKYGFTSKDFTDGMHSKAYVSKMIIK